MMTTITEHDGSDNDQPPTVAADLAYSAEEPYPGSSGRYPEHYSWRTTFSRSAVITMIGVIVALVICVGGVVLVRVAAAPVLQRYAAGRSTMPAIALPPIAAPAPEPTATLPPTPNAMKEIPPAPPKSAIATGPSEAELDERYLGTLTHDGLRISDVPTALRGAHDLRGAHELCAYRAAGHSEGDAVAVAMRDNRTLTEANARAFVEDAERVYCPRFD